MAQMESNNIVSGSNDDQQLGITATGDNMNKAPVMSQEDFQDHDIGIISSGCTKTHRGFAHCARHWYRSIRSCWSYKQSTPRKWRPKQRGVAAVRDRAASVERNEYYRNGGKEQGAALVEQ